MKSFPKIRISIPFCILISVMYVLDFGKVFLPTFIAVLLHEAAHILAVRLVGGEIDKIDIRAFGVSVNVPGMEYLSYSKEIIIAAAGPLAGILTASLAFATAKVFGIYSLGYFIGINIIITAINLIPVFPLDGGRIVLCFLLKIFSVRCAYVISYILALLAVGILCGICIALAHFGRLNPSLVLFSGYVALCGIKAPRL